MIDVHCHVDAYPDPYGVAQSALGKHIIVVAVTNTPAHFAASLPHVQKFRNIRPAIGLHPLLAEHTPQERALFARLLTKTSYVGEVGLDFSREGIPTQVQQIESFEFLTDLLQSNPKYVSIHSRQAETEILNVLEAKAISPVVLHWFTGSSSQLERALAQGHYLSINPAMLDSEKGRSTINHIPLDRILLETDGPYARSRGRICTPLDTAMVEHYLSQTRRLSIAELRSVIFSNFMRAIPVQCPRQSSS